MRRRPKAALLWGVVGALAFLVLLQGYVLVGGRAVGIPAAAAVAVAVGVVAGALSYLLEGRVGGNESA